ERVALCPPSYFRRGRSPPGGCEKVRNLREPGARARRLQMIRSELGVQLEPRRPRRAIFSVASPVHLDGSDSGRSTTPEGYRLSAPLLIQTDSGGEFFDSLGWGRGNVIIFCNPR